MLILCLVVVQNYQCTVKVRATDATAESTVTTGDPTVTTPATFSGREAGDRQAHERVDEQAGVH